MQTKARQLRKNQTDAETRLRYHLRSRWFYGYKFRRQYPVAPYIADFVCPDKKLIIEIDDGQHAVQVPADAERTAYLEAKGFAVIRFWNNQVLNETEAVLALILEKLEAAALSPRPSPPIPGAREKK